MENASKALIIAGAILVSILIISVGVMIFGQAKESIDSQKLDDVTLQSFNSPYESYEGTTVRGSDVKQLIKTVSNHNRAETDDSRKIRVLLSNNTTSEYSDSQMKKFDTDPGILVKGDGTTDTTNVGKIGAGTVYTVQCHYNSNSGLVGAITVYKTGSDT